MAEKKLHEHTENLLKILGDRELAPHLETALSKLSSEHLSGITLAQLDTPMMRQFKAVKEEVPDCLVFFRMGDFFELFGSDAIIAADICGLTLTSRDRNSDNPVPMAGVPAVAYKVPLKKCIAAGFKVAVCDQVEDPRQAKGIVKREITRIATPAVPGDLNGDDVSEDVLNACYLASVLKVNGLWTLSFVDVATSEFRITEKLSDDGLCQELLTILPKEVLVAAAEEAGLQTMLRANLREFPRVNAIEPWILRSEKNCRELFLEFFEKNDENRFSLSQIASGLNCVAAILSYLKTTQRAVLQNIKVIKPYETSNSLKIDDASKRHLDFFVTGHGERRGSLYWLLNHCLTATGSRALARRLNYPFKTREAIEASHVAVNQLVEQPSLCQQLSDLLRATADLDRIVSRAAQGSIDPRGLVWLRTTLNTMPALAGVPLKPYASRCQLNDGLTSLATELCNALVDEPAAMLGKGGTIFKTGYAAELDDVVSLTTNFEERLAELERFERERTQISTLKIGYTRVFGYYFEISKGKLSQAPAHFIRKQTIANGERFITPELKELEDKAMDATERRMIIERELFDGLRKKVLAVAKDIASLSDAIAELDLIRNFATLAVEHGWCLPEISEHNVTCLKGAVHPVMKAMAAKGAEPFVPNDICVGELSKLPDGKFAHDSNVLLITGPNMAGKSTVMRQLAIAQILFQMGSFVPAREAAIGVSDAVLTRIGSSDFALKNQSTFMVEMLEAAHMLRLATSKSLLVMDEIGRGTSTYDGLSIAWAILEDLHDRLKARALFSTHYHELQKATVGRDAIASMQMEVIERFDTQLKRPVILFSRRFVPGAAERSYGIHVAELAGLAPGVVARASEILTNLTTASATTEFTGFPQEQTPIHVAETMPATDLLNELVQLIAKENANDTTPREALDLLFDLQERIDLSQTGVPYITKRFAKRAKTKTATTSAAVSKSIFDL